MASYETTFTLPVPVAPVVPAGVLAAAAVNKSVSEQQPTSLVCRPSGWHIFSNPATLKMEVAGVDGAARVHLSGSNDGFGPLNADACKKEVEAFWRSLNATLQQWAAEAATAAPMPQAVPPIQPTRPSAAVVSQYPAAAALTCAICGKTRKPEAAFCSSCGASLARYCPACGGALSADARFCLACGYNVTPSVASPPTPALLSIAASIPQPGFTAPASAVPSAPAVPMGQDVVDTPILRLAKFAFLIFAFLPWIVSGAHFFLPASVPFVKEVSQLYVPIMAPFQGVSKSIASGMQVPTSNIIWLVAGLAYFILGMLLFAIASRFLHQKVVLVPQAELDARFQASKELRQGLAVIFVVVIVVMVIYWFVNNPLIIVV